MVALEERTSTGRPLVVDLWTTGPSDVPAISDAADDLAALARAGAPLPHGFSLTDLACDALAAHGHAPQGLWTEVEQAVERLELRSGLRLGDPARPLLLSVRSGLPGAVVTSIVGIGMNDEVADRLAEQGVGDFAARTYGDLLRGYGQAVLGVRTAHFDADVDADPGALLRDVAGEGLPQDPVTQMRRAIDALALAWRADAGRSTGPGRRTPAPCSLAVVQLVSGERDARSGCGVAYSRSPVTGAPGLVGEYLPRATIEDLRGGLRRPLPLTGLRALEPEAHAALAQLARRLETESGDVREIEFVVEAGRLWVARTATAERSPDAAFRIACSLVDEGLIDLDEALRRVDGAGLQALLRPGFVRPGGAEVVTAGVPAVPGNVVGRLALDAATASAWAAQGLSTVLALSGPGTGRPAVVGTPHALITDHPALASPTTALARHLGIPCVAGIEGMTVDREARLLSLPGGIRLEEGSVLSVDGTAGRVCEGRRQLRPSALTAALHGTPTPTPHPTVDAALRLLAHADRRRHVEVHANAESPEEARIARRLGAQGIGLLRTEHLLLGPRRELVERIVTGQERNGALSALEALMSTEFTAILEAMDGLPVVVRLLDPPLHEFLPDLVDLSVQTALAEERGQRDERLSQRLLSVRRWRETNPLLGLRGVRTLTVLPQIVDVQVRALAGATLALEDLGRRPRPQIMIPLVAEVAELAAARDRVDRVVADVARAHGRELRIPVGVMIELPRAALTAAAMAHSADFFSFGTNDLTQTVWGISRDDAEASFLAAYREEGILPTDPFVRIDEHGVGRLVRLAAQEGRAARPTLGLGACGRHVEDPASVGFFTRTGLDYLSCSTPALPVVRLEAGRQAVLDQGSAPTTTESR